MDLAHSAAVILDRHNLIKYDRRTGNMQVCYRKAAWKHNEYAVERVWRSCCLFRVRIAMVNG